MERDLWERAGPLLAALMPFSKQDGPWDKNAWKTDAFYGNPLTGFTPPQ